MVKSLYSLFADALEYPTPQLPERVKECVHILRTLNADAAHFLDEFRMFTEENPVSRLEEVYTGTFDLQALCCPYAGYQLFGEDYARGMFMARLREEYQAHNFSSGNELPDHISILLRFLSGHADEQFSAELIAECLIPALEKMALSFPDSTNPYGKVLRALMLTLPQPDVIKGDAHD